MENPYESPVGVSRLPATESRPPRVSPASCSLIAVSLWTLGLILVVRLLDLPGGRGPVQYAHGHSLAMLIFNLRVITMLAMLGVPFVALVLAAIRSNSMGPRSTLLWRLAALGSYVVAWLVLFGTQFFPTA